MLLIALIRADDFWRTATDTVFIFKLSLPLDALKKDKAPLMLNCMKDAVAFLILFYVNE